MFYIISKLTDFGVCTGFRWMPNSKYVSITDVFSNGTQSQLDLTNIKAVLELGQLSNLETNTLFLHSVKRPEDVVSKINQFVSGQDLVTKVSTRASLPPSSSSKFLTAREDLEVHQPVERRPCGV